MARTSERYNFQLEVFGMSVLNVDCSPGEVNLRLLNLLIELF